MRQHLRRFGLEVYGRLAHVPPGSAPPRRILLIRPDHLGDLLLAAPAIAALRQALPRACLSLMVGPWSLEAARRAAEVDEVLTCPFPGFDRQVRRGKIWPYVLLRREAALLRGRFDLAVVLRPDHWWGALLATAARVPRRLGFETRETGPLLTNALPFKKRLHAVEQNRLLAAAAAQLAGGSELPASLPLVPAALRLEPDDHAWAVRALEGLPADGPRVLIHAGSGSDLKAWPVDRWARLADVLAEAGAQVIFSGGPNEIGYVEAVQRAMVRPSLSLAGHTRLGQLAAVLTHCTLAIGSDNGPLHLAAGLGVRTVRLYGPSDPAIFGPPPSRHCALAAALPCRPCGNLVAPPCGARAEPPCMLGIRVEAVADAARELLDTQQSSRLTEASE